MADLTDPKTTDDAPGSCCSTEAQATCCEPGDKAACCGESAATGGCGCSAGRSVEEPGDIREAVRSRYAAAATSVAGGGSCCDSNAILSDEKAAVFGAGLYGDDAHDELPDTATMASLGCGNPTAVAELNAGETRADMAEWTGCIAGALTRREFEDALAAAGLEEVEIVETHRVHEFAGSAIIRARKPS